MDEKEIALIVEALRTSQKLEQSTPYEHARVDSHFMLAGWSNKLPNQPSCVGITSYGIWKRNTPEDYVASIQVRAQAAAYALVSTLDTIADDDRLPAAYREMMMDALLDAFLGHMGKKTAIFERSINRDVRDPNAPPPPPKP